MLRIFEAFAGVGSQRMALRNLGIEHKVVGIAEIDKFALQSYEAIHGDCPNFGDISKINPKDLPDMDLFTYSFPCQDLSVAGKQAGLKSGTRSGLLYECEKVIEAKRPKYLLLENVKNLVGKKFKNDFNKWLDYLETLGYKNYWKVLNAKNYGVPQNRERVFVVSILGEEDYNFPEEHIIKIELENLFKKKNLEEKNNLIIDKSVKKSVATNIEREIEEIRISEKEIYQCKCLGGWQDNKIGLKVSPTLRAGNNSTYVRDDNTIRKLTPLECWRLMGFKDEDFYKAEKVCSNTQLYKQAGNSIVVPVLEGIFRNLLIK